jgi:uncharacterized membrane protein YcaP (DUF421 family)
MAGEYRAITDGLILVATIIGWEYVIDLLTFHNPTLRRLIDHQPLPVIQNGKINHRNLKRELMTEEDLLSQIRLKGVDDVIQVRQSFIEGDGHVSVITDEKSSAAQAEIGTPTVDS